MSKPPVQPPNYTAIPNVILDAMPSFTDAELRVVLAVCRKTFGWHKERDAISISQLETITGLSRQGVVNALGPLLDRQIIDRVPNGLTYAYRVLVNEVDQSSVLTSQDGGLVNEVERTSQHSGPEVVNVVDTQKKRNKEKESIAPAARTPRKRTPKSAPAEIAEPNSESLPPTPSSAPPPSPKLSQARMAAYVETVTGLGLQTSRRDAKPVLDELAALDASPEEIAAAIKHATARWSKGYAYPLAKVPDAVRSWRAVQKPAASQRPAETDEERFARLRRHYAEVNRNHSPADYRVETA